VRGQPLTLPGVFCQNEGGGSDGPGCAAAEGVPVLAPRARTEQGRSVAGVSIDKMEERLPHFAPADVFGDHAGG
jgi:hypothetical protein